MKRLSVCAALAACLTATPALAHFQMIIPSDDMVVQGESKNLTLDLRFWHPLEGHGMPMARPLRVGVLARGKKTDLAASLKPVKLKDRTGQMRDGFTASHTIGRGDHVYFVEPAPYWESAEDKFIIHYTKVVVNGLGVEDAWDQPVGLKTEIIPLTRPYGLYSGNVFQGRVLLNGKPVPGAGVEVEFYDEKGAVHPPAGPMVTQVVKADAMGVFTYAMPRAGWWGFAALSTDDKPMKFKGQDKEVEIGAVLWVKTYDMK
ncbi:MAG: DUF4198 domain-containing protein [Nitrospirota bacterium]|nr:DUF4198 domain-containing protein [Nitrospirota bacterium]